jgi:hypothetical protein
MFKWYNNSYLGANVAVPIIEPRSKPDPLDQARPDQQRGIGCFNDLLVINRIVPKLPSKSLMRMLSCLKPYHDVMQTRKSDMSI